MTKKVYLAGGCFWCTEAIYKRLKGVISVRPGYSGGNIEDPNYEAVSSGTTGHAETIEVEYDDALLPYEKIVEIFLHTHNPTTLNQQGADRGTQYRSAIFYQNEEEKALAEKIIQSINNEKVYPDPIVTEVTPFTRFYPAEEYHQDYYDRNKNQDYCSFIITPKIAKLLKAYANEVKNEYKA